MSSVSPSVCTHRVSFFVVLARPAGAGHAVGTKYRIPIADQREFLRWFQQTKSA
jgi:hypothetical protein